MEDILIKALAEYGTKEIEGQEDNPKIVKYFKDLGFPIQDDETSWCAAFVNWCAKQLGYENTGQLTARSFLNIGTEITIPKPGDIVVYWRGSKDSWMGHVGFFVNQDDKVIYTLGGNQSNQVTITPYPKARLLGYRRLQKIKTT